jgi:hypothetical protein
VILAVIVACEIGFWVLLGAGLLARYGLHRPRLGAVLLICVPLVDLILLVAGVLDLRGGAEPSAAHGLAAVYIGFSVGFGHRTIAAMDRRVAHRYAGGPAPARVPKSGPVRVAHEWDLWRRALTAWLVALALLGAAIGIVGDDSRTGPLVGWAVQLTVVLLAWLLLGPIWSVVSSALSRTSGTDVEGEPASGAAGPTRADADREPARC